MAKRASVIIPTGVINTCRFRSAVTTLDGRVPGKGLTGTDLHLWLTILDTLRRVGRTGQGVVMTSADLSAVMGVVNAKRVTASLDRLRGYDVWIGNSVMPTILAHSRSGTDWIIKLDVRVIASVVAAEGVQGAFIELPVHNMRKLSSRYSLVLWLRYMAMSNDIYPPVRITFNAWDGATAFRLNLAINDLGWAFGFDDIMPEAHIRALLLTNSPRCAIGVELASVMVKVDTVPKRLEIDRHKPEAKVKKRPLSHIEVFLVRIMPDIASLNAVAAHAKIRTRNRQIAFESKQQTGDRQS